MSESKTDIDDDRRWELALAHVKRADEAANYLRALLFALSSGSLAFVYSQIKNDTLIIVLFGHVLAIIAFAGAIWLLIKSWDVQKRKAGKRFELLRDYGAPIYRKFNNKIKHKKWITNHKLDRGSVCCLAAGAIIELLTKVADIILSAPFYLYQ